MASDSSSVRAFMRTIASPSSSTLTRQSTRASPWASISTVLRVNSSSGSGAFVPTVCRDLPSVQLQPT